MADILEVKVPDIGDFDAVDVIEILVAEGDAIAVDDSLITLESDKASMEVPSTVAGRVEAITVEIGDKVGEGDVIARIAVDGAGPQKVAGKGAEGSEASQAKAPAAQKPAEGEPPPSPVAVPEQRAANEVEQATGGEASTTGEPARPYSDHDHPTIVLPPIRPRESPTRDLLTAEGPKPPFASPSVRRFARELGVPVGELEGSGRKGRILKEDVQWYVRDVLSGVLPAPADKNVAGAGGQARRPAEDDRSILRVPPVPAIDFSRFGTVDEVPMSRIRIKAAANLHRSWLTIPRVTQFEEADITELEAFRQQLKEEAAKKGVKLTPLPFIMKAVAAALEDFPDVNASLHADGDKLIYKRYYHLGVAVDTDEGLVVPVIRDVDRKGLLDLAKEVGEASERARAGKLQMRDLQGASFTISSLGAIGGTGFTPIINPPEAAILGVSRAQQRPVWDGSAFVPRLMLPFSLVYDHRVVDGATAGRFVGALVRNLTDVRRLAL